MHMVKILVGVIVFFVLLSCENIIRNKQLTGVVKEHSYKGFKVKDSLTLSIEKKNDTLFFEKFYKKLERSVKTIKLINNDSILVGENAIYHLIKYRTYSINSTEYTVYKYLFDEEGIDEEEDIFYTDEYGVIYSRLWWFEYGSSYEYDSISSMLVQLIVNDTTGFYKVKVAPPPSLHGNGE